MLCFTVSRQVARDLVVAMGVVCVAGADLSHTLSHPVAVLLGTRAGTEGLMMCVLKGGCESGTPVLSTAGGSARSLLQGAD